MCYTALFVSAYTYITLICLVTTVPSTTTASTSIDYFNSFSFDGASMGLDAVYYDPREDSYIITSSSARKIWRWLPESPNTPIHVLGNGLHTQPQSGTGTSARLGNTIEGITAWYGNNNEADGFVIGLGNKRRIGHWNTATGYFFRDFCGNGMTPQTNDDGRCNPSSSNPATLNRPANMASYKNNQVNGSYVIWVDDILDCVSGAFYWFNSTVGATDLYKMHLAGSRLSEGGTVDGAGEAARFEDLQHIVIYPSTYDISPVDPVAFVSENIYISLRKITDIGPGRLNNVLTIYGDNSTANGEGRGIWVHQNFAFPGADPKVQLFFATSGALKLIRYTFYNATFPLLTSLNAVPQIDYGFGNCLPEKVRQPFLLQNGTLCFIRWGLNQTTENAEDLVCLKSMHYCSGKTRTQSLEAPDSTTTTGTTTPANSTWAWISVQPATTPFDIPSFITSLALRLNVSDSSIFNGTLLGDGTIHVSIFAVNAATIASEASQLGLAVLSSLGVSAISTTNNTATSTTSTTTSSPIPTTTNFPTTLVAVKQYGPIPANITEFPTFTAPTTVMGQVRLGEITGKESMEEIASIVEQAQSSVTAPVDITLRVANPNLGTFAVRTANLPFSLLYQETSNSLTFSSSNLNELAMSLRNGYVFSASPEAVARNLTERKFIEVLAKDKSDQEGRAVLQINALELNRGPEPSFPQTMNATFNVSRAQRFVVDLNSTFVHSQQLPMSFASHQTDLFPLPRLVRVICDDLGNCSVRGVIDDDTPLRIETQASDGYILRASYVTIRPVFIPIHPNTNFDFLPVLLRPGQDFLFPLPDILFVSSTDIRYTDVRLSTGFLLPRTMTFDPPNLLRGSYDQEGLLQVQVRASDIFADSVRNFTLNFTNIRPFCRNDFTTLSTASLVASNISVSTPNVPPVTALQEFERTIEFSEVCNDVDNDPMRFDVNAFELPTWVRFIVRPGGTTILPQSLRLSGIPPKELENSTLFVNVTVTDIYSSLSLSIPLRIAKNVPPVQIRALPNFTINPGSTDTFSVNIPDFFEDPNGDALIVSTEILTEYAKIWLQTSIDSKNLLSIKTNPEDEISGEEGDARDADEQLLVRIEDPFGNSTTAIINIYVRLTLWQKLRTFVYVASGLLSLLISIVSTILLYPIVINFIGAGEKQIPCPLNAKNREWTMPEDASVVQITDRATDDVCMAARNYAKNISVWAYDEMTLEEFAHGDPPQWLEKTDRGLKLNNVEKEPGTDDQVLKKPVYEYCFVRVYNRRHIILTQFDVRYHEVTKDWDFEKVEAEEKAAEEENPQRYRLNQRRQSSGTFSIDLMNSSRTSLPFSSTGPGNSPSSSNRRRDSSNNPFNNNNNNNNKSNGNNNRNNNNNNNNDHHQQDDKLRDIDTRIKSIDIMLDEEMSNVKKENLEMRGKISTLESILGSLMAAASSPRSASISSSSAAQALTVTSPPPQLQELEQPPPQEQQQQQQQPPPQEVDDYYVDENDASVNFSSDDGQQPEQQQQHDPKDYELEDESPTNAYQCNLADLLNGAMAARQQHQQQQQQQNRRAEDIERLNARLSTMNFDDILDEL